MKITHALIACCALLALGGCAPSAPVEAGPGSAAPLDLPTPLPDLTATALPAGGGTLQPGGAGAQGVGAQVLTAVQAGPSVYSGYACIITPEGCACQEPVFETVSFELTDEGRLLYSFQGEGYGAEWEMSRLSDNRWTHTIPLFDNTGAYYGAFTATFTFTGTGYEDDRGAIYSDGGFTTCDTVTFRRLRPADG